MVSYKRLAYGRPKDLPGYGKTGNGLMNFGVKIRQVLVIRPTYIGYRRGGGSVAWGLKKGGG